MSLCAPHVSCQGDEMGKCSGLIDDELGATTEGETMIAGGNMLGLGGGVKTDCKGWG